MKRKKKMNPWISGAVKLIFALLFLSNVGTSEETGPKVIALLLGLGLIFWAAWPFLRKKQAPASVPEQAELPLSFDAAGVNYREEGLISLAEPSRAYTMPDDKLAARYPDGRKIYQFFFPNLSAELIPEPTNPHDPNAIKVELNGVHVGYVPAELCQGVLQLLKTGYLPRAAVRGGPYKCVEGGAVVQQGKLFFVHIDMIKE